MVSINKQRPLCLYKFLNLFRSIVAQLGTKFEGNLLLDEASLCTQ